MAIIWQKKQNGKKYEVRSAGASRRLYTNNVCHSEFNPKSLLSGSIWDLLIIPAFFYPAGSTRRVLVLGVGGGAAIMQIRELLKPASIVGVELDPLHLEIAERFFNVSHDIAKLHLADAEQWLNDYDGPAFDLIIDDLFTDIDRQPERALEANSQWFTLLLRHLTHDGQLVVNFGSFEELKSCGCFTRRSIGKKFPAVFSISGPLLDNKVGVFLRRASSAAVLRQNLVAHSRLGPALQSKKLRYNIRPVNPAGQ